MGMDIKYEWDKFKENFLMKIAWIMPKRLAYWCFIRVSSHATQFGDENEEVPSLIWPIIAERWAMDNKIKHKGTK